MIFTCYVLYTCPRADTRFTVGHPLPGEEVGKTCYPSGKIWHSVLQSHRPFFLKAKYLCLLLGIVEILRCSVSFNILVAYESSQKSSLGP